MSDIVEAIREVGKLFIEREEANLQRHASLIEFQQRAHREVTMMIVDKLDKSHRETEKARARILQKFPDYDGTNINFNEWEDKVVAIMQCNDWSLSELLECLPISLNGMAKQAVNNLREEDKISTESFFRALRLKLDPESETRNRKHFMDAKKLIGESMTTFIDRCRMFIRRSSGDPEERFIVELLKGKVMDNIQLTDKKILQAALKPTDDLDNIVFKADSMMVSRPERIGLVTENLKPVLNREKAMTNVHNSSQEKLGENSQENQENTCEAQRSVIGPCGKCHQRGHTRKYCPLRVGK